ncbi:MAG: molybdate ABC transporter substrate-binding protein [Bacteroidota bacterium]
MSRYFFVLCLLFSACTGRKTSLPLRIATAANMQFVMEALAQQFEEKYGIECDLVVSSSGKLTAQIQAGAPFDLFISANMIYPEAIYQSGLAKAAPKVYAYGKLVLWTMLEEIEPSIAILSDAKIKHIALPNPKTAPYGMASEQVLRKMGVLASLSPKLVYGESIAQSNQFIITQSVAIGFTAMSVVQSPSMRNKGRWIAIDRNWHTPIEQGIVLLKSEPSQSEKAKLFYQFLFSKAARKLLNDFGYTTPSNKNQVQ